MVKHELMDYIKRQLGYPTVNVEVTDEQLEDCIQRAVNDINPWYTVFKYITVDVGNHCIDLTEYKIKDVTDVMKVFDSASINSKNKDSGVDPFTYSGMNAYYGIPMYSMQKYNNAISNRQNIHKVISSYAQMYQEQFYSQLAVILQRKTAGTLYENISWKFYDNKLYIDTGVPSTTVVTIEYIPNAITVEDFDDNTPYCSSLKDLSTAFALQLQARVVGKYQVSNSPTSINYQDMRADAEREIERVRNEIINKISNRFYITD